MRQFLPDFLGEHRCDVFAPFRCAMDVIVIERLRDFMLDAVLQRLTRGLAPGDILLLHDGAPARTRDGEPVVLVVLPELLDRLAARGLKSVTLPDACRDESAA